MAVRFVPKKNVYTYYEKTGKLEDRKHEAFVNEISTMVEDMLVGVCIWLKMKLKSLLAAFSSFDFDWQLVWYDQIWEVVLSISIWEGMTLIVKLIKVLS